MFVASLGFSRVNMFPESFWLVFVQAVMDWLTRKRLEALTVALGARIGSGGNLDAPDTGEHGP